MKLTRASLVRGAFYAAMLALVGYLIFGFNQSAPAVMNLDGASHRVTGPYVHENMAVYLIHADEQDERKFITLFEGLERGVVKVTEKESEQVNELLIENTGTDFLFLQEGDRVTGGKQDRTIYASFVVPPKSGKMPLPAFCVEQSRWTAGAQGNRFGNGANPALAPKEVRCAAKVQKDQTEVWAQVAGQKSRAEYNGLAANSNSSLTETLDAPKVKKASEQFATALAKALKDHPDAIGVAIAINGRLEEINCYPNHQLLKMQYPRLIQSYALQAVMQEEDGRKAGRLSAAEVCQFVAQAEEESARAEAAPERRPSLDNTRVYQAAQQPVRDGNFRRNEKVNSDNQLEIVESVNSYNCKTAFDGKLVHRQLLSRYTPSQENARQAQNGDQQRLSNVQQRSGQVQQLQREQIENGLQNAIPNGNPQTPEQQRQR